MTSRPAYKSHPLWNQAIELARDAYELARRLRAHEPSLARSLRQAAVSVPAHVAEALSAETEAKRHEGAAKALGALAEVARQAGRAKVLEETGMPAKVASQASELERSLEQVVDRSRQGVIC